MRVIADHQFRRLLVGETASSIAASALWLALGVWAKSLTHSNALAGCVFLALGLPSLLSPFGGHLVDRVRRKPLLVITNAALGAIVLVLLVVHGRQQLWLIYGVAAATGLALDILASSRNALLKDLLPDESLGPANALVQTMTQGTRLLSPLLGVGLYTWVGPHDMAIVDTALFGVATVAMWTVRVTESAVPPTQARFVTELMAGFRHVRAVPLLLQLVLVGALAFGVVGLFDTVTFAIVDQGLHRSPSFFGVLDMVQGAGAIAGAVISARVLRRFAEARTVGIGLALVGLGCIGMMLPFVTPVVLGTAVLGVGVPLFVVGWSTGLQRYTPPRLQGRVNAAANLLLTAPQTASIALGAALIAIVDYRILLLVICFGMVSTATMLLVKPAATTANSPVTALAPEAVG
jgi:MFS family permease